MAITSSVGPGNSASKLANTCLKDGTTNTIRAADTKKATSSTVLGYIRADLIFDFMASVFSRYEAKRPSS